MCKAWKNLLAARCLCTSRRLLKNAAVEVFPLNSNTLILIKVFAHNLFHKICEEERAVEKASSAVITPGPGQRPPWTAS
jgi:hypothetical protein